MARRMQFVRNMPTSIKTRTIRERLHNRRRKLVQHYRTMLALADEEQTPEAELIDAANEQWDVRVLSSMSEADATALEAVRAALQRLDAGCYGRCVSCHARIERERLHILPEAAMCFDCAVLAEAPLWTTSIAQ
jgi:RNA polymerase-binding transcription factor DksA